MTSLNTHLDGNHHSLDCLETLYLIKKQCYDYFSSAETLFDNMDMTCKQKKQQYTKLVEGIGRIPDERKEIKLNKSNSITSVVNTIQSRKSFNFREEAKAMIKVELPEEMAKQ
jgi:hypothetical protein